MNQVLLSAVRIPVVSLLLLSAFSSAPGAGEPTLRSPGTSAEEDWLELDAQLVDLARGAALLEDESESGMRYGVLLRGLYVWSEAEIAQTGGDDPSGFILHDVDLSFETGLDDFSVRVSVDVADGTPELEDAYARWRTTERLELQLGSFKPRVLLSNGVDPDSLLFIERTALGALFDDWDVGVQARLHLDEVIFYASVTNGEDGIAADHRWVARLEWSMFDAAWHLVEGAHDAPNYLRVLLGGVYVQDDALGVSNAHALGFDASLTLGPTALAVEWMDLADGLGGTVDTFSLVSLPIEGGSQPYSVTLSHFVLEGLEAAFRYQELDDSADTQIFGGALRWFPGEAPVSWVADVTGYDREGPDGIVVQVGMRIGTSRP